MLLEWFVSLKKKEVKDLKTITDFDFQKIYIL